MIGLRYRLLLLLSACLPIVAASNAAAQSQEYKLKAAFLYNFGLHVTWPETEDDRFVICVLGKYPKQPFGAIMRDIQRTKTLNRKKIVVGQFDSMDEYTRCHILFISRYAEPGREGETAEDRLEAALERTKDSPVLLVTETPGLAGKGAVINFLVDTQANRIKMEINLDAAERAGLIIGARLRELERSGKVKIVRDN